MNIIEQLNNARLNKKEFTTRVEGDIVATFQVKKREDKVLSEVSFYYVDKRYYLVLHEEGKHPDPEDIIRDTGNIIVHEIEGDDFNCAVEGVIEYRNNSLEEHYINTYSYLCGWCLCEGFPIHEFIGEV